MLRKTSCVEAADRAMAAVIRAISAHMAANPDVALFAKVLWPGSGAPPRAAWPMTLTCQSATLALPSPLGAPAASPTTRTTLSLHPAPPGAFQ